MPLLLVLELLPVGPEVVCGPSQLRVTAQAARGADFSLAALAWLPVGVTVTGRGLRLCLR
jgi:hypothetical protein